EPLRDFSGGDGRNRFEIAAVRESKVGGDAGLQLLDGGGDRVFGLSDAPDVGKTGEQPLEVAIVDEPDAMLAFDQYDAGFIDPYAIDLSHRALGMRLQIQCGTRPEVPGQAVHVRRVVERNKDPLRPV